MHADESACVIELRIIPKNKRKHRRLNGRTKSRPVIIVKDRLIRVLSIDEVVSKLAFSNGMDRNVWIECVISVSQKLEVERRR